MHPQDVEHARAGVGAEIADGLALGAADVDGLGVVGGDVLEARLLGAPVLEVVDAHAHELDALRRPVAEQGHEPVRFVVGQPADHGDVDDAEHRRGQANPERQGDDGGDAEAGPPDEHPDAVAEVTERVSSWRIPRGTDSESRPYVSDGPGPQNVQDRPQPAYPLARARRRSKSIAVDCPSNSIGRWSVPDTAGSGSRSPIGRTPTTARDCGN